MGFKNLMNKNTCLPYDSDIITAEYNYSIQKKPFSFRTDEKETKTDYFTTKIT